MRKIVWPDAGDLDTVDACGDYSRKIYLDPDTVDGEARFQIHSGVGNIGTPMRAFCGRWRHVATIGAGAVGETVLDALRAIEADLQAHADAYQGTRWDGSNHHGAWKLVPQRLDQAWETVADWVLYAWDAAEWYGSAGSVDWLTLCREHKIDPERGAEALDDLEQAEEEQIDACGEIVGGVRQHLARLLADYQAARGGAA